MSAAAAAIAAALSRKRIKARGGNYLVPCPCHHDREPSLSIRDGDRGLIVNCFAGCGASDVLAALRQRGLLDNGPGERKQAPTPAPEESDEHKRHQHNKARWLWSKRQPLVGTIAETYLRGRKITCALPAPLGFLPSRKPEHHPALIAAFALVDEPEPGILSTPCNVGSVHLTLLKPDGSGKAEIATPKIIVGSPRGLPIVLAPPNDLLGLAITEGLEDALTAHQMTGLGAWAAGAAGFLPKLADVVPNYIEAVTIYAHADKAGQEGTHKLAQELRRNGIDVAIEGLPS